MDDYSQPPTDEHRKRLADEKSEPELRMGDLIKWQRLHDARRPKKRQRQAKNSL